MSSPGFAETLPEDGSPRAYTSFAEVRNAVLDAISGSTKRIWLSTDYLTDGEIVSALYVAQYRKLDVMVLLGRGKANNYMSRLNYLKNQNIPVYLKPDSFKSPRPTALLCDDKLYYLDGELDFMAKVKKFTLESPGADEKERFTVAFAGAANLKVPAVAHSMPLVGKARPQNQNYKPSLSSPGASGGAGGKYLPPVVPTYSKSDGTGAYTYDRKQTPRPDGVPAKLPKDLKWMPKPKAVKHEAPKTPPASAPTEPTEAEAAGGDEPSQPVQDLDMNGNVAAPDLDLPAEGG